MKRASSRQSDAEHAPCKGSSYEINSQLSVGWIAKSLISWFDERGRELPWRSDRTPWGSLVSEFMLQQTQLARVVDHWPRFMAKFPSPRHLASSEESRALSAWEGLGYYRRVRLLRNAAMMIVREHSGATPTSVSALQGLPGVGRYTAGAVASIVAGERAPIVDANVVRVFLRLGGVSRSADDRLAVQWCWNQAERFAEVSRSPGVSNEALMELGGTVCTRRSPNCSACPLQKCCKARAEDMTEAIPLPKRRAVRSRVYMFTALSVSSRGLLLEQRSPSGLWGSMWQPPTVESATKLSHASVAKAFGLSSAELHVRDRVLFQTTHRAVEFHIFDASRSPSSFPKSAMKLPRKCVRWKDLPAHALSSPLRTLVAGLAIEREQ